MAGWGGEERRGGGGGVGGGGVERKEQNKRRVKFARRVRQRGVETEFTLERRSVRARSKGEERRRRRRHSGEPLGNLDAPSLA